jgi:type II secretory pathway pseudopilin PulG
MNGQRPSFETSIGQRRRREGGFTLVEMLLASLVVIVGLVAVAQLVPSSLLMNANNRSDGTALVLAQKQMEALRALPLTQLTFKDPNGVTCPLGNICDVGDPTQPGVVVGSPVQISDNTPIIDFTQPIVAGYGFTYTDPNDPSGAVNDVRWAVITSTNGTPIGRRIIVGAFRRGMKSLSFPISLDTMVTK